ncbi:MAG TPA: hypothetical protein PL155_08885 [Candidatus Omnitrophota bacterium]|nr:hypothetical protein [Candidatus Omnitrophota bacterium]HPD85429.1 hypothetical protein [Candidatus Omnitrophota bacterium]HRZ04070.1 hypothetical protein [Candidatus Omnitrophota bacterium]
MKNEQKRKKFFLANEFQKEILMPALVTNIILILVVTLLLFYLIIDLLSQTTGLQRLVTPEQARVAGIFIFGIVLFCSFILVHWCYKVSNRFAGPLGRVTRELQEIIDGKRDRSPIIVRSDDYLADLISKVNILLKQK